MTWLWRGTHAADLPGFPATGQTIRMSGATVYMFDADDRLTGHWQITDRLGVYQQLQRGRQEALPAPIEHGIAHPFTDGGFAPAGAARGDAHLLGKRARLDLAIEGSAGQAGAIEHGIETQNAVRGLFGHGVVFLCCGWFSCSFAVRFAGLRSASRVPKTVPMRRFTPFDPRMSDLTPGCEKEILRVVQIVSQAVSA
jgi:hypothetical protein